MAMKAMPVYFDSVVSSWLVQMSCLDIGNPNKRLLKA